MDVKKHLLYLSCEDDDFDYPAGAYHWWYIHEDSVEELYAMALLMQADPVLLYQTPAVRKHKAAYEYQFNYVAYKCALRGGVESYYEKYDRRSESYDDKIRNPVKVNPPKTSQP